MDILFNHLLVTCSDSGQEDVTLKNMEHGWRKIRINRAKNQGAMHVLSNDQGAVGFNNRHNSVVDLDNNEKSKTLEHIEFFLGYFGQRLKH